MKVKIIEVKDLPPDWDKHGGGRPRAKLDMSLLRAMRDQDMSIREISSRTGISKSVVGDALRGKLTTVLEKRRRRERRKERHATVKTQVLGNFWCQVCFITYPIAEQSPDPRYCQGCHDFLLKEAERLPSSRKPPWVPRSK